MLQQRMEAHLNHLVKCREDVIGKLNLGDRCVALQSHADAKPYYSLRSKTLQMQTSTKKFGFITGKQLQMAGFGWSITGALSSSA